VVGSVASQLKTDRLSDNAAGPLAADDVAGVDGEALLATIRRPSNRMIDFF
jgi:hypothetical protein